VNATRHAFSLQLTERCNSHAATVTYGAAATRPVDCTTDLCERFVDFALRESGGRVKIPFSAGAAPEADLIATPLLRQKGGRPQRREGDRFSPGDQRTLLDDEMGSSLLPRGSGSRSASTVPRRSTTQTAALRTAHPVSAGSTGISFASSSATRSPGLHLSVITSADALPCFRPSAGVGDGGLTFNPAGSARRRKADRLPPDGDAGASEENRCPPRGLPAGETGADEG